MEFGSKGLFLSSAFCFLGSTTGLLSLGFLAAPLLLLASSSVGMSRLPSVLLNVLTGFLGGLTTGFSTGFVGFVGLAGLVEFDGFV
jgi:hypothetical protein